MISNSIIAYYVCELLIIVTLPIALMIILKVRTKVSLLPVLAGILVYIIVVMNVESLFHYLILGINGGLSDFIKNNTPLYIIYSTVTAALFEETARLLMFKYALRKYDHKDNSLAFGLGYGGIEAILIIGMSALLNLAYISVINDIGYDSFIEVIEETDREAVAELVTAIKSTTLSECIMTILERITALVMNISLSVAVFYAVQKKVYIYYVISIVMHVVFNVPAALSQTSVLTSDAVVQISSFIIAAASAYAAYIIYKRYDGETDPFFGKKTAIQIHQNKVYKYK